MSQWARGRGLRYERFGYLPQASDLLEAGQTPRDHAAVFGEDFAAAVPAGDVPARWDESLCTGVLPGRVEGTLSHHSYRFRVSGGESGGYWVTRTHTVVLARVLDGIRIARDLEARRSWPGELSLAEREYGRAYKRIDAGGLSWDMPVEEGEELVRLAVRDVPPAADFTLREGIVVASVDGDLHDPADLDGLCQAAAAFAHGLQAAARTLPVLGRGDTLPDPRPTPYRQWVDAGVDRVRWPQPPPTLDAAVEGYREVAGRDPRVGRRRGRARATVFVVFLLIAALIGGVTYIVDDRGSAILVAAVILLLGLACALLLGRQTAAAEGTFRREAWGLGAFATEYARSRGLYAEDPDEFRRRFPMPFPGSPQRVMRGHLPGGADGRIVLWRDRNLKDERAFVNVAIVEAPPAEAQEPFVAASAQNGFLVVAEWVDRSGRSMARLDAVATEASRLAKAAAFS